MIDSAVFLFREHGVDGTAFSDVLEHSGAPRGSVYHHFPGGKKQLAREATRYAGDVMAQSIEASFSQGDPVAALRGFIDMWSLIVEQSEFRAGCPIVAAALEGDRSPGAHDQAAEAFNRWADLLSNALQERDVGEARALALATLIIASIEGAIVLSRAQRTTEPLRLVGDELCVLLATAVNAQ
jgi:AcrR family transcriptional regulator